MSSNGAGNGSISLASLRTVDEAKMVVRYPMTAIAPADLRSQRQPDDVDPGGGPARRDAGSGDRAPTIDPAEGRGPGRAGGGRRAATSTDATWRDRIVDWGPMALTLVEGRLRCRPSSIDGPDRAADRVGLVAARSAAFFRSANGVLAVTAARVVANAEHRLNAERPAPSGGGTLADHWRVGARSQGPAGARYRAKLIPPPCPVGYEHIWGWFWDLRSAQGHGMSWTPISYEAIAAWSAMTGHQAVAVRGPADPPDRHDGGEDGRRDEPPPVADVATLVIRTVTSEVQRATADLLRLQQQAGQTEQSTTRFTTAMGGSIRQLALMATGIGSVTAAVTTLGLVYQRAVARGSRIRGSARDHPGGVARDGIGLGQDGRADRAAGGQHRPDDAGHERLGASRRRSSC